MDLSSPELPGWLAEAVRGDAWAMLRAHLFWQVARATRSLPPQTEALLIPPQRVREKLQQGIPLAHREDLFLDYPYAVSLFGRLCNSASRVGDVGAAQAIAQRAALGELATYNLVSEGFMQHWDHAAEAARSLGLNARLLVLLAWLSALPLWWAYSARLGRALQLAPWERGYCPICGAWPALMEEPAGLLACMTCAARWPGSRAHCVYCSESSVERFHRIALPGGRELLACRGCERYLKIRSGEPLSSAHALLLDDLASIELDRLATQQGLRREQRAGFELELEAEEG